MDLQYTIEKTEVVDYLEFHLFKSREFPIILISLHCSLLGNWPGLPTPMPRVFLRDERIRNT